MDIISPAEESIPLQYFLIGFGTFPETLSKQYVHVLKQFVQTATHNGLSAKTHNSP